MLPQWKNRTYSLVPLSTSHPAASWPNLPRYFFGLYTETFRPIRSSIQPQLSDFRSQFSRMNLSVYRLMHRRIRYCCLGTQPITRVFQEACILVHSSRAQQQSNTMTELPRRSLCVVPITDVHRDTASVQLTISPDNCSAIRGETLQLMKGWSLQRFGARHISA